MNLTQRVSCVLGLLGAVACGGSTTTDSSPFAEDFSTQDEALEAVSAARELMITDLAVVNDPKRTVLPPRATKDQGVWSFGALMTSMAGPVNASDFVLHFFQNWEADFSLNGATAPARPTIRAAVLDPWPKLADGRLDLTKSPLRLLAVAYRPDLLNVSSVGPKQAGEGRFVFGVLGATGNPLPFTIILEYGLPAATPKDIRDWAHRFHDLGKKTLGTEDFNHTLQDITLRFAARGACPAKPNGSCINQIRSNEVTLAAAGTDLGNTPSTKLWELREFRVTPGTGQLDPAPVNQTPDLSFKGGAGLTDFINQNEAAVLNGTSRLPASLLGPSAKTPKGAFLELGGIVNPDARFAFGVNTCDGCHSTETGTPFLHIHNRAADAPAELSGFLTGTTTLDPVTGQTRSFNDLAARAAKLQWILFVATDADLGKTPKTRAD